MDIIVNLSKEHRTDVGHGTQLYTVLELAGTEHTSKEITLSNAKFRSGSVENPLVVKLKSDRCDAVIWMRNIPMEPVLERGGFWEAWVAVYPPGDRWIYSAFDPDEIPRDNAAQVHLSIRIQEDITPLGSMRPSMSGGTAISAPAAAYPSAYPSAATAVPTAAAAAAAAYTSTATTTTTTAAGAGGGNITSPPAMIARSSVSSSSSPSATAAGGASGGGGVFDKELQAREIKAAIQNLGDANRRALHVTKELADKQELLQDLRATLRRLEPEILQQKELVAAKEEELGLRQAEEARLSQQIAEVDREFMEWMEKRRELDRDLTKQLALSEEQSKLLKSTSAELEAKQKQVEEDLETSRVEVTGLKEALQKKRELLEAREAEAKAQRIQLEEELARERERLARELEDTRAEASTARSTLQELQEQSKRLEKERAQTQAAIREAEAEAAIAAAALEATSASIAAKAQSALEQKQKRLADHNEKVRKLEAELETNRGKVKQIADTIKTMQTQAQHDQFQEERLIAEVTELQEKLSSRKELEDAIKQIHESNTDLLKEISEAHAKRNRVKADLDRAKAEYAVFQKKKEETAREGPKPQEPTSKLSSPVLSPEKKFSVQLAAMQGRLKAASKALQVTHTEEEDLRKQLARIRRRLMVMNTAMQDRVDEINQERGTMRAYDMNIYDAERENEAMLAGLPKASAEGDALEEECYRLKRVLETGLGRCFTEYAPPVERKEVDDDDLWECDQIGTLTEQAEYLRGLLADGTRDIKANHQKKMESLRGEVGQLKAKLDKAWTQEQKENTTGKNELPRVPEVPAHFPSFHVPGLSEGSIQTPAKMPGGIKRKALVVGINYEQSHAPLKGGVNDGWNIASLLRQCLNYGVSEISILIETPSGASSPFATPTEANIRAGLEWLVEDAQPTDNLFFAFSGYGAQLPSAKGSSRSEGFIVPIDFAADLPEHFDLTSNAPPSAVSLVPTPAARSGHNASQTRESNGRGYRLISMLEIGNILAKAPAGVQATVMMDCCYANMPNVDFSGAAGTFPRTNRGQVDYTKLRDFISRPRFLELPVLSVEHNAEEERNPLPINCSLYCFFGSKPEEWSAEFPIEGTIQGAFSWAFIKALAKGNFNCGVYQFKCLLSELLGDMKIHFRGVEQAPVVLTSESANLQDLVLFG